MSRESAFCDLMGTDRLVAANQYGPELTLPGYVHGRILDALAGTADDGAERSVHFRHGLGRWRGGMAVKGTGFRSVWLGDHKDAASSRLHERVAILYPPHLQLHTHPQFPDEIIEAEAEELAAEIQAGEDDLPKLRHDVSALDALHGRFPSSGDVRETVKQPRASVAHLLISETGSFVWVHRYIRGTKGTPTNPYGSPLERRRQKERAAYRAEKHIQEADTAIAQGLDPLQILESLADIEQELVSSRVRALDPAYVCYSSSDPENPTLTRGLLTTD